ncbi:Carotenoid oxygenase [Trinorchestia longiramus]|nr:Carotenoid oxygenase [Trinorchestia longiramus]
MGGWYQFRRLRESLAQGRQSRLKTQRNMKYDFSTNGRHCETDTPDLVPASVTGTIPDYICGEFIFNGNGLTKIGDAKYKHCFDSAAIIQKVVVTRSGSSYMSRFLQSSTLAKNKEAGSIVVPEFGTPTPPGGEGLFGKLKKMADMESMMSDNSSLNVYRFNNKLHAVGVTPFYQELDEKTLETKGKVNLYKDLGMVVMCPHYERLETGVQVSVGQSVGVAGSKYNIIQYPETEGSPQVMAKVTPRWRMNPCFMHGFGVSQHYMILFEQPMSVGLVDAVKNIIDNMCFIDSVKWLPSETVMVTLVDTRTWKIYKKKFIFDAHFILHFCNCYEEINGDIVVDFMSYSGPEVLYDFYIEKMQAPEPPENVEEHFTNVLKRIVLPLSHEDSSTEVAVTPKVLSTVSMENPHINPNFSRRQYTFVYGIGLTKENCSRVSKVNVKTGEEIRFCEDGLYATELVYVPNPSEQAEDDGTVAAFCLFSAQKGVGCLLLLSAADLSETARITFNAADTVTSPMHGQYFPASAQ